jgi:hypothetical protein
MTRSYYVVLLTCGTHQSVTNIWALSEDSALEAAMVEYAASHESWAGLAANVKHVTTFHKQAEAYIKGWREAEQFLKETVTGLNVETV